MECNKEEAIRAKELAEKKMVCGDFVGAQKLVVKAQRLFPDLENLTQLVAICDVHCSAQKKINGLDNWYGILQVELFADEAIIKKQYRKLALLLHPDKNKFAGAEAAFKLIGEAHRLLADRITRSQYDVKCRAFSRGLAVRAGKNQPNMNPGSQSAAANYVVNSAGNQKTSHLAFWTCCQFCKYRYKYLREYVSQVMFCYNCQKYYVAVDVGPDAAPTGPTSGQFSSPKEIPAQGPCSASAQNDNGKATGVRPLGKSMSSAQTRRSGSAAASEIGKNAMMEEKLNKKYKGSQRNNAGVDKAEKDVGGQKNNAGVPKPEKDLGGQNNNDKAPPKPQSTVKEPEIGAAKPAADTIAPEFDVPKTDEKATSKSKDTKKKRKDVEEIDQENTGAEPDSNGNTKRRSSRKKPQVTYAEDGSDDDFVSPPSKKSKSHKAYDSSADAHKEPARENMNSTFGVMSGECKADGEEVVPSSDVDEVDYVCEANENPDLLNCPDPEFNSFEKTSNCFAVHQVWAIYDPIDGMPRFYAQIKKVLASPLLVKMTWLEFTQGMENETNETIPTACGKFENGETEDIDDHLVFSHQMHYVRRGKRYVYIYPKKGEIWALFRDWDVSWTNNTQKHKPPYKYDFVEVLCDYSDVQGIRVGYLRKLKGFVSLFNRVEQQGVVTLNIPPGEMHRFSHKVPSFKMSGNEKEGVPAGSFELDPAALPSDIFDLDHKDTDGLKLNAKPEGGCPNSRNVEAKNKVRPEQVHTPKKRHKTDGDDASSPMLGTSAENASNGIWNNQDQVHTSRSSGPEDALNRQKFEKGGHPVDALKLRKSPRALSEKNSRMNSGQQKIEDTSKQKNSEGNELSGQSDGDGLSANKMNTPRKLEKDVANEALRLRRSPRSTNKTDGQLQTDHGIAENVGRHSNLKNHETNEKRLTQSSGSNVVKKSSNSDANLSSSCRSRQESSVCFEEKNSDDRFQVDQIWALYNNTNGMPTDYVQIKDIETTPKFRLHAVFLEPCLLPKNSARPICCGVFKLKPEKAKVLPQSSFSHQLNAVKVDNSRFEVYPRKGEIWALHRTACSDTSGGHDIVEVTEENSQVIKVAVLTVNRLKSQYRAWKSHGSTAACITTIQRSEVARFSHQIPVIRNQPRKDRLGGFWELDPSAIPSLTITLD